MHALLPQRPPTGGAKVSKRFTVRDGFHLKERNDEKRVEIDDAIASDAVVAATLGNQQDDEDQPGPTVNEVPAASVDREIAMIFDFLDRPTSQLGVNDDAATTTEDPVTPLTSAQRQAEAAANFSRLGPSSDWLIYRHRTNATPRRKEQQLEEMIANALDPKATQVPTPAQRVHSKHRRLRAGRMATSPQSNRAFGVVPSEPASLPETPRESFDTSHLATKKSRLIEATAVPLKTEKLLHRLKELRLLPAAVERVLEDHDRKRQAIITRHGENLVVKNKQHPRLVPPLQRPPQTPVFPSLVELKQHEAARRKQLVEQSKEQSIQNGVNRWQNRRLELQQQARLQYVQAQWLLLVHLGQATAQWRRRFFEFKTRRDAIFRMAMAKRIQRSWRHRRFLTQHATLYSLTRPMTHCTQFYRIPAVLHAIHLLQQRMRAWLLGRKQRQAMRAVAIIITSWLEFQDVKFRRLILRFRKRVREFQTMWRTWRAITDARLKLLLLVWSKVERKHRRRGGVAANIGSETTEPGLSASPTTRQRRGPAPSPTHSPSKRQQQEPLHHHDEEFLFGQRGSPQGRASPVHQFNSPRPHHSSMARAPSTPIGIKPPVSSTTTEKIPMALKVSMLRHLLSKKRKAFQADKTRKRAEWKAQRQQQRRIDFRYNVMDELTEYQRFEAQHAVFLLLQSVSEHEILQLIHPAHDRLTVSTNLPAGGYSGAGDASSVLGIDTASPHVPLLTTAPSLRSLTPNAPSSSAVRQRYDGPRRSTFVATARSSNTHL